MKYRKGLMHCLIDIPRKIILSTLLLSSLLNLRAQQSKLNVFEPLIGKTWKAEGNWGDGSKFKQESVFEYALQGALILVNSKGYTNQAQTEYGNRNHGVRRFDNDSKTIRFIEYDVFGGVTEGIVHINGKNFRYEYDYGGTTVTDEWKYVDDDTYNFKVGSFANGEWKQIFLETQFKATTYSITDSKD